MSLLDKKYELKKLEDNKFVFKMEKPYEWHGVIVNKVQAHEYNEEELVELFLQIKKVLGNEE